MMIGALLVIAGAIYIILGALHAVFTLMDERNPRRLAPDDPAVTEAMRAAKDTRWEICARSDFRPRCPPEDVHQ